MTVDQIPIGRFSVVTRLSQKALRYYDAKGLLTPGAKDPFTGYRYYTGAQIQRGVKIRQLSDLGFSVEEMAAYFEAEDRGDGDTLEKLLSGRLRDAERELTRLQRVVSLLRGNQKEEMFKVTMSDPVVKEVPRLRVLSKRETGSYDETIGKLIGDLMRVLYASENQRNYVKMVGPVMTIYHDEEYREEGADIEMAVPITGKIAVEDPTVEVRNLEPCRVVSLVHKGSYETIGRAYQRLHGYVSEEGLEIAGPMRDLYLNDPNKVAPDEIMTEVQAPVKP
ncbi:MAG: MerR family transcriptional regulator [Candidatus Bathyarchaeota archaeon]